jgi:small-conductance mechanosensitive channel
MMNPEIQLIWNEILADISTPAALWQILIVATSVVVAFAINGALRAYFLEKLPENMKPMLGAINRILFPISTFLMIVIARYVCADWMHVSILSLASRLLLAMIVIRLVVYVLRYIFSPSGWLKTLEHLIAWIVWIILALHLSGVLPEIGLALEEVKFNIGKNPVNLLLVLQAILTVIITIFIALWVSRLLENRLMAAEQVNINLRVVLTKLIRIVLIFIATLVALSAVGLDITLLSVFGGALGVGLGLGMQRIASNYVSGFIILLDKSMQIGDVVSVDKHYGVVQDLRSRYMVLSKLDGTHAIIPNETLITTAVVNHSLTEHKGPVKIELAVSMDSPIELALQLMQEIPKQHKRILDNPAPAARIKGFSEHGVDLTLTVWVSDPENGALGLQSALFLDVWKVFKKNNISFVKSDTKPE